MTRLALVGLAWAALHLNFACGTETNDEGAGAGDVAFEDVVFEGATTEKGLEALLSMQQQSDLDKAAWMTSPPDGGEIATDIPQKFAWRIGPPQAAIDPVNPIRLGLARPAHDVASELREVFGPIREAHAQEKPMNGRGFLLLVKDQRGESVHRAFTTALEHTIPVETLQEMATHEGPFEACVVTAFFGNDHVVQDGGPWDGPWIVFNLPP